MTSPPRKNNNYLSFHQGVIAVLGGCLLSSAMTAFSNTNGIPTIRKNTNEIPMVSQWYLFHRPQAITVEAVIVG